MSHPEIEESADYECGKEKGTGIPEGKAEIEPSIDLNLFL
jgi:hypothetical protein